MIHKERRRRFLINKSLQFHYMLAIVFTLLVVTSVSLASLYLGIWGGILDAFSNEKIRNDLLLASRIQEYEDARSPQPLPEESFSTLSLIRRSEHLSQHQREIFREILDQTNRSLIGKLILLLALIAWGTLFLSHKIAGPFYRFQKIFERIAQGDLSVRCYLRKFDEAQPVAKTLNQAVGFLDSSISRLKNILRENEKNPDRLGERLKEDLSKFKTTT